MNLKTESQYRQEIGSLWGMIETGKRSAKKYHELYLAVNDLMAHLGAYGEINNRHALVSEVMRRLHEIEGGCEPRKQRSRTDLADGQPCSHQGCLNHATHPCEGCGRVAGRMGNVEEGIWQS